MIHTRSRSLIQNTLALYGLHFVGFILPLVTLPYLSRVLTPQGFGLVLFAQSFALWGSLTIEYGFNLSATRRVAQHRDDAREIARHVRGVLGAKVMLSLGLIFIFLCAGYAVETFRDYPEYLWWALLQALAFGFSPFWYFQGTERLLKAVSWEFIARVAATGSIFLIVVTPYDGWKALAAQAGAGCVSTLVPIFWIYREVPFQWPRWNDSLAALKDGWCTFLYRGTFGFYTAANSFILGVLASPVSVAYYGGAERIAKAIQNLSLPFTQALYPRISHLVPTDPARATRVSRLGIVITVLTASAFSVPAFILAPQLIRFVLGAGYEASAQVLRILAFLLPLTAMNNGLIMHWMIPREMERGVGFVTLTAVGVNLTSAAFLVPRLAHFGMALAVLIAETFMLASFVGLLLRRRGNQLRVARQEQASVEFQ